MENKRIFDFELERLTQRIIQMCTGVNKQVANAITALKENNLELANEVIANDHDIDSLDVKIDKLCQKVFALQQPVASDLRFIMSALKINNDLERIGDHAVNIAQKTRQMEDFPGLVATLGVDKAGDHLIRLTEIIRDIIESHDLQHMEAIYLQADQIKEECKTISGKILHEMMMKSEVVVVASNMLGILNHIERIAGYSTNIAESVTFVVQGEIMKHRRHL